ncbi:MAG: response regulator [Archangium sp.]|nr:response regulator [Archangium sp.]
MKTFPGEESGGRRVAIVEDEGILALDIERHLSAKGYDVCGVAADSDAAIELVGKERPDLVLMDIRIQGPRDGVETATALREKFDIPIVYLTAHSDPRTIERAQRTAPFGYLVKPFKKPDLDNVVHIALARSNLERQLKQREEVLSTTLACLDEAVFTVDRNGLLTWANPAATRLCGLSNEALRAQRFEDVLPLRLSDGGELSSLLIPAPEHGQRTLESTLETAYGSRTIVGAIAPLRVAQESFGVVIALRDVTELLEARRQLEFSERLSALGTLAAEVAHELNNPLTVVLANLEFMLTRETDAGRREPILETRDASMQISRIVNDLRTYSRPQLESRSAAHPAGALGAALGFTRAHWRRCATVRLRLGALPAVLAAHTRLTQIFVNLIMNAAQAMEGRAQQELVISTSTDAEGRGVIVVGDTGPGIPAELRQRIFEPFVTTKPAGVGTGLGLAVSRGIAESHGGTLELLEAEPPVQTRFSLVLPPTPETRVLPAMRTAVIGPRSPDVESFVTCGECRFFEPRANAHDISAFGPDLLVVDTAANYRAFDGLAGLTVLLSNGDGKAGDVILEPGFDIATLAALVTRDRGAKR